MDRVNQILNHPLYREALKEIQTLEKDRIFCKHNISHFLDVARLGEIQNLKEELDLDVELIYATALLHDIGRHKEYLHQIPHEEASAGIAEEILNDLSYTDNEKEQIKEGILNHGNERMKGDKSLAGLIYRSDKLSRACFACEAEQQCNWSETKKNKQLREWTKCK
ncbi:uncharacterized protein M2454_002372 [Aequitasia blattaphilus]|uniref:HD domain-containing protein n=1 Tax=Aequitasia blattaphilus TaxID=2949332 RepID=A0ABT1EEC7_9FIRM|nr:HD domain-containing protein [Aequitasia blattaphilus]MCP1102817.1 HD domain-containing protein [Aequitasia blattaphilus]MCR8615457.1 HD domain-containing protein [Aequitasia blattaphilus]